MNFVELMKDFKIRMKWNKLVRKVMSILMKKHTIKQTKNVQKEFYRIINKKKLSSIL